jgi:xanthine dehydrogenase accessory factor
MAEHFDMRQDELARLHGPVGLKLGAKTPAEISVSILAEIVQLKNAELVSNHSASSCEVAGAAAG